MAHQRFSDYDERRLLSDYNSLSSILVNLADNTTGNDTSNLADGSDSSIF
jgi:hypothetical protein